MKRQLLPAVDVRLPRRGRLKDEPGASRGAADAVPLVELQVGELEDEFFQRLGLRLRRGALSLSLLTRSVSPLIGAPHESVRSR